MLALKKQEVTQEFGPACDALSGEATGLFTTMSGPAGSGMLTGEVTGLFTTMSGPAVHGGENTGLFTTMSEPSSQAMQHGGDVTGLFTTMS